jgi:glutamyl-Q tRNA(Asp) synthetase
LIVRRDGLPAYHLAVVVDDALQGITDVVRGSDLLSSTPLHIHLQEALSLPSPRYWHVPVLTNASGAKLSKQQGAAPIDPLSAPRYAASVLTLLELPPPPELERAPAAELWKWAIEAFDIGRLAGREALTPPESLLGMADERKS